MSLVVRLEGRGEVRHDLGVGVERGERLAVVVAPAAQAEPRGLELGDGHRTDSGRRDASVSCRRDGRCGAGGGAPEGADDDRLGTDGLPVDPALDRGGRGARGAGGGGAPRGARGADRGGQQGLLRGRCADPVRRRVGPALPAPRRPGDRVAGARHPGFADPARRRPACRARSTRSGIGGRCSRSRTRSATTSCARSIPASGKGLGLAGRARAGTRPPLRRRAEDRRPGDHAPVRARPVRPGRDARGRHDRRGRDGEPAHDRGHPVTPARAGGS